MRAGEVLLEQGTPLDATKLGLIASAGRSEVQAIPGPAVAVVPTGDEIIPPSQRPQPGQIRNSNGVMLAGLARAWGARQVRECPVSPDDPSVLRASLGAALEGTDVLLISGGVSAGTKDLVPSTLMDLGIEPIFHKVHVKPGKPLWFGIGRSRGDEPGLLVFGLPGNPVSGVVGFLLFVRPALEALAGRPPKRTQLASFFPRSRLRAPGGIGRRTTRLDSGTAGCSPSTGPAPPTSGPSPSPTDSPPSRRGIGCSGKVRQSRSYLSLENRPQMPRTRLMTTRITRI